MNLCEALNTYANNLDWICYGVYFFLGTWKLWELMTAAGRWAKKRIL